MKNKSKILILKTVLQSNIRATKAKLKTILEEKDIHISYRTLERYIKELTDCFFIEYSQEQKAYVQNELINKQEIQLYLQYLNINVLSQNLIETSENIKSYASYILYEAKNYKGIESLEVILSALKNNKELIFLYATQYKHKSRRYIIPLFLKEYQNRWYLIALDKNKKHGVRTFGLDRISEIKQANKINKKVNVEKYKSIFENIIGIDTRPFHPKYPYITKVVLKATNQQPHYFKSLPLHKSQQIIEETENYTLFQYHIKVNFEFVQHINMYAPFLKVIEPEWLQNEIKAMHN